MSGGRRFSKAWNEEFEVMKQMQDDRMMMHNNLVCHERCVSHYMTNGFLLQENTCMKNCLAKLAQSSIITNLVFTKFEESEAKKPVAKKK